MRAFRKAPSRREASQRKKPSFLKKRSKRLLCRCRVFFKEEPAPVFAFQGPTYDAASRPACAILIAK
jgi:hypothetical protein